MKETEMGNRGSKSIARLVDPGSTKSVIVKEQPVDGSWHTYGGGVLKVYSNGFRKKLSDQNPFLANIKLIGFAGDKQQLLCINRGISNTSFKDTHITMSAWWLTGFVDAEGCFRLSILKNKNYKKGGKVLPFKPILYFQIWLHRKDEVILESMKFLLGVGKI